METVVKPVKLDPPKIGDDVLAVFDEGTYFIYLTRNYLVLRHRDDGAYFRLKAVNDILWNPKSLFDKINTKRPKYYPLIKKLSELQNFTAETRMPKGAKKYDDYTWLPGIQTNATLMLKFAFSEGANGNASGNWNRSNRSV
jgi:hypothetical protein